MISNQTITTTDKIKKEMQTCQQVLIASKNELFSTFYEEVNPNPTTQPHWQAIRVLFREKTAINQ